MVLLRLDQPFSRLTSRICHRMNISFLQNPIQGNTGNKCAPVEIVPDSGLTPRTVNLDATAQSGGHIFYTKVNNAFHTPTGIPPTHSGDTPTGSTIRVGTNFTSFNTGSRYVVIEALCYQAGFLDSDITIGSYGFSED